MEIFVVFIRDLFTSLRFHHEQIMLQMSILSGLIIELEIAAAVSVCWAKEDTRVQKSLKPSSTLHFSLSKHSSNFWGTGRG